MQFRNKMRRFGGNTDTLFLPGDFNDSRISQAIAIRELGVRDAFKDFLKYLAHLSGGDLELIFQNYYI